jgi:hypothetical protein
MSLRGFETHRCEGSLAVRCSIRRYPDTRSTPTYFSYKDGRWHLYQQVIDFDYDVTYMSEVAAINVCPWCGKRLGGSD